MANIPIHKKGDFVQVYIEGFWQDAMVEGCTKRGPMKYNVCVVNTARKFCLFPLYIRTSEKLKEDFLSQFEEEIPDLSQQLTDNPSLFISQHPWDDGHEFSNPPPLNAPKRNPAFGRRFRSMSEADIDKLQMGSKAYNTHRSTQWALRVFRGMLFTCYYI